MRRFIKYFTIILFILIALALLAIFIFSKNTQKTNEEEKIYTRVIKPASQKQKKVTEDTQEEEIDNDEPVSLIELYPDETLLNAISVDINGDSFDDQIISIKRAGNSTIFLLTGLYNTRTRKYQRVSEINTGISQVKTFSFSIIDVIGTHTNTLVYTGNTDKNETTLKVLLPDPGIFGFKYETIADFTADGTIFIQQIERNDSYLYMQTNGESFPIWVYSSDTNSKSLDQIQTMYKWSDEEKYYVKVSESRVTGKKIAAAELQRIQDGTPETFEKFLTGLWYKSTSTDNSLQYIFFDAENDEIIFATDTTQEIYIWTTTSIRRNGAYLTSQNKSISNLIRRFDIALNGIDEIRIKVNDDVKMSILQETLWDGTYKKTTLKKLQTSKPQTESIFKTIQNNKNQWITANSIDIEILEGTFKIESATWTSKGAISQVKIEEQELLQFRTLEGNSFLEGFYLPTFETEKINEKTQQTLTLSPVQVKTSGFALTGDGAIVLTREIE